MDYFDNFIKECIRDLKKEKKTFCFFEEQINEIKKVFPNIIIKDIKGEYFEISLAKVKVAA